jgi:hypothetical protein
MTSSSRHLWQGLAWVAVVMLMGASQAWGSSIIIEQAPPYNTVQSAPGEREGYVWAPGYYVWSPRARVHVWVPGRWVEDRPGYVYQPARWAMKGAGWIFYPEGWTR